MSAPLVMVHLSDLHVHRLPRDARQWLGKRGLGALNVLLRRGRQFPVERMRRLVRQVAALPWDQLVVTGDLTQLGLREEFAWARELLEPLLARGPEHVTILPGNHDRYVPEAEPGFETYFGEYFRPGPEGVATRPLAGNWSLAVWDSAIPLPPFLAGGRVQPAALAFTERWLEGLPPGARVVVACHYPVCFPPAYRPHRHHELTNLEQVRQWLGAHPVDLYLHGHIHANWVLSMPSGRGSLLAVNSASSSQVPRRSDRSAFHRIELDDGPPRVYPLRLE
jgi:3',5'-cyclic AMP phosphodiesterase CpdA